MDTPQTTSVLFVCLGNICRSPLAEGVFLHLLREAGLDGWFTVDSAGTGAWHVGELPDPRSREVAERNGVTLPSRARQVTDRDFHDFDVIVAMDRSNLADLQRLKARSGGKARLVLMRDFDPDPGDGEVPDPYYGGASGFDRVYAMVFRAARGLMGHLNP
ncbi:MAG TPA: low molecular weight protein-tyrosine-phosphatase [Longimicrobiales bacterium]|nr:low molecular weight protein-tyrosine-phosphatase [Longimicrobiales bacterium]